MLRILIFSIACLVVFIGLATTMPILEDGIDLQHASAAYPDVDSRLSAPSCIISANPNVISKGESASLAWTSKNTSEAALSGVGAVAFEGGVFLEPPYSDVYTLMVRSISGETASCNTYITVR